MDANAIQKSSRMADVATERMQQLLESVRFQNSPRGLNYCYEGLASAHHDFAINDYFVANNKRSFKQHLHVASKLDIAALALYDYQRFTVGSEIFFALLSDSSVVIDSLAKLEPPYFSESRSNPIHSEFKVHMFQLAIQADYKQLGEKVVILGKSGRKKDRELYAEKRDFFSLLMRSDKQALEKLITAHANIKSQDPAFEDFMCFQGTMEAKICWRKGIEVQIDHPMVPMTLMPIEPLEHYDDVYEFLKPGYVPPKVGFVERLRYRYQERVRGKALIKAATGIGQ